MVARRHGRRGPDPEHVVARTRECCRVALLGNHDYDALRATEPPRFVRSFALARERLDEDAIAWMRSRRPAAKRVEVQCWHASPRNAVHEYVGAANAPRAWRSSGRRSGWSATRTSPPPGTSDTRRVRITPGEPLDISDGKWLLNPGAVGAPASSRSAGGPGSTPRPAPAWLLLDLEAQTATWLSAPFDPAPAHARVRELGLDDG